MALDQKFLARQKVKLEVAFVEVDKEIELLKVSSQPVAPDNSIGRLSRMDAIAQKSVNEAALDHAKKRFVKIISALKRLNSEEYGYCLVCEDEISLQRLTAVPETTTCIDCAS